MPFVDAPRRDLVIRVPRAINITEQGGVDVVAATSKSHDFEKSYVIDSPGGASSSKIGAHHRASSPIKGGHREVNAKAVEEAQRHNRTASSSYQYSAQATSTAEWNSLLIWARRQRGPQWDSGTSMWQVDQGSTEYYAFANDPARHSKLSRASNRPTGTIDGQTNRNTQGALAGSESNPYAVGGGHAGDSSMDPSSADGRGHRIEASSPPLGPGMRRSRMR